MSPTIASQTTTSEYSNTSRINKVLSSITPPIRIIVALGLLTGGIIHFNMRICINVAIIEMTKNASKLCPHRTSNVKYIFFIYYQIITIILKCIRVDGNIFCWTEYQISLVKGSFYIGYVFLQFPGGRLAEFFGVKRVLGWSTVLVAILTLITPLAADINVWFLIVIQTTKGLFQGVLYPCFYPAIIKYDLLL